MQCDCSKSVHAGGCLDDIFILSLGRSVVAAKTNRSATIYVSHVDVSIEFCKLSELFHRTSVAKLRINEILMFCFLCWVGTEVA